MTLPHPLRACALATALCVLASAPVPARRQDGAHAFRVTSTARQTIDGFGASDAWSMWRIGTWDEDIQQRVADWLFSSDTLPDGSPKGIALSVWRFNAGTGSAGQGDQAQINPDTRTELYERQTGQRKFLRMARDRGVPVFLAFYNSPPVSLTQNGLATNTGRDGTLNLRPDSYRQFADHIATMIETARDEDGIRFDYVSPVNEPDGHWNWQGPKQEGTPATNREVARLVRELSGALARRGLDTRILINESSDYRCMLATHMTDWQRGYEIQSFWNPDSADTYVGGLPNVARLMAGHSYWTTTPVLPPGHPDYGREGLYGYRKRVADALREVGTDLWMTELCIMSNDEEIHGGGGFDPTMQVALYVARVMHYDLTVANARSWQWWRAAGGDYKDGLLRIYVKGEPLPRRPGIPFGRVEKNDVADSKLLWTIGNYSRFVRPGARRLDVEGEADPYGLMLSAYRNTDGSTVVVAVNYAQEDAPVSISVDSAQTASAYRTSDAPGENLKHIPAVTLSKTILPARSVTTFVIR